MAASLSFVFTNPVHAQGQPAPASVPDPLATSLFQDAVALLEKGEWKEACAKFEASMARFPAPSTLLNIARCHEHEGKLSLAWSAYQRALVINRETQPPERKKELDDVATGGLAAIEPRVPHLKIVLAGAAPAGLHVTHNGKEVPVAVLNTVIPVDPGEQTVVADAPGFEPFKQTVTVAERGIEAIALLIKKKEIVIEKPTSSGIPMWSWISAGAGVALLAGAAGFRIDQAFVEGRQAGYCHGHVDTSCPPKSVYDPTEDNERKNRDNGLFVGLGLLGVAGLGAAVIGFVRGQPAKAPANAATVVVMPGVGPSGVSLGVGGRF